MSLGRRHLLVLDQDNLIWELRSYGRVRPSSARSNGHNLSGTEAHIQAYHHTAPSLTSPTNPGSTKRPHHIIQVSAGWSHSACLTSSGQISAWYPFSIAYREALTPDEQLNGARPTGSGDMKSMRWGTVGDIIHELDPIPERPEWDERAHPIMPGSARTRKVIEREWEEYEHDGGTWGKGKVDEQKVVKIASGSDFAIALKQNGEVWYRRIGEQYSSKDTWEYVSTKASSRHSGRTTRRGYRRQ